MKRTWILNLVAIVLLPKLWLPSQQSLQQQEKVNEEIVEDEEVEGDGLLSSAATLVVAPLSLLSQVRTDGQPYTTSARKLRVLLFKWICSRARLRRRRF